MYINCHFKDLHIMNFMCTVCENDFNKCKKHGCHVINSTSVNQFFAQMSIKPSRSAQSWIKCAYCTLSIPVIKMDISFTYNTLKKTAKTITFLPLKSV